MATIAQQNTAAPVAEEAAPNAQQQQQQQPAAQFASLYVGDLKPDVTEAMLYEVFNGVGPVASIRVCRDSVTRRSLGYAYVNFHNVADAERALDTLNYSPIRGKQCRIMWSHRDPTLRKAGNANVFVKNLDKTIDNKALYDTFSLFGNILSCKVATDDDGKSRGYGFVHFENDESAHKAITKLNGMMIGEKAVYVGPFQKHAERAEQHGDEPRKFTNVYIKHLPESWTTEEDVQKAFEEFGKITSVAIQTDRKGRRFAFVNYEDFDSAAKAVEAMNGKDMRTQEEIDAGKGEEESTEEGSDEMPEYKLYVTRAQTKTERSAELRNKFQAKNTEKVGNQSCNLYVKNLPEDVDDEKLRQMFEQFGEITSPKVMVDENTGVSRGFGFVCFANQADGEKAIQAMHLKLYGGKPLFVAVAEKRDARIERLQQRYRAGIPMGGFQQNYQGYRGPRNFNAPNPSPMYYSGGQNRQGGMMQGPPGGFVGGPRGPMGAQRGPMMSGGYPVNRGPRPTGPNMMPMNQPPRGNFPPQQRFPGQQGGPFMGQQGGMPPRMMPEQHNMPMPHQNPPPMTAAALASAPPGLQKQMLGERLFTLISKYQPTLAGKITGMMLEMDNSELLMLIDSDQQLRMKIDEAVRVLQH
ncbi:Polyadenylate-binding protein, putative [Perkinsus marinus ATCC 50983]|uniref:Polyadenylate-binding protein n=1 Tax=Perkinsus marinus (strain ATCC 50983 / TXsc) TaxID=423536 RepID=C5LBM1_PERM5|nr:Polyadenylate-binding protein, putative [Perkinsus marinus ATCC 50983]EER05842.1 Polyadenylate-binding protein, putative [Perkinsus marinus ATCC 50983]|eukprot:XP_002774026.1 Polyadenylate-binding protein, putative [Perkinsus marinus ATCC 50983]